MNKDEILQALEGLGKLITAGINNVTAMNDSQDAETENLNRRWFDMQIESSFRQVESHRRWLDHVDFVESHLARQSVAMERIAAALEQWGPGK